MRGALGLCILLIVGMFAAVSAVANGAGTPEPHPVCGALEPVLIDGRWECIHGEDTLPVVAPPNLPFALAGQTCDDGRSGPRYQVLYVRGESTPSRFAEVTNQLRRFSEEASNIFVASAAVDDAYRAIRYVRDPACNVVIEEVAIPDGAVGNFGASTNAIAALGYNRPDRNYLMFVDATTYCGIGTVRGDSRKATDNRNAQGRSYSRVDRGCWGGFTAAHEVAHNLGAVQQNAPNRTEGWHCTDEADVMCYVDGPGVVMRQVCPPSSENLLDCGRDDYFDAGRMPEGYLAGNWNIADSPFLDRTPPGPAPSPTPVATPTATPVATSQPQPTATPTPRPRPEPICKWTKRGKWKCR